MEPSDTERSLRDRFIEENLKRAFAAKANEDVPDELLELLDRLKAKEEKDGRG